MLIFVRVIDIKFEGTEERVPLRSTTGTITEEDIFNKLSQTLPVPKLKCKDLKCVTTNYAANMVGYKYGVIGRMNSEMTDLVVSAHIHLRCINHHH